MTIFFMRLWNIVEWIVEETKSSESEVSLASFVPTELAKHFLYQNDQYLSLDKKTENTVRKTLETVRMEGK